MYLTMVDPLKDLANTLSGQMDTDHNRLRNLVIADSSQDYDYYKTLGVTKDATKQEIHRAFRQLAKKYHPDKNKDKSATEEFIKIFKAYETLSDEKKRKEYDQKAESSQTWNSANLNDFDINDFFRQYEDQFMRHTQHHESNHNQQHYDHHRQQHNQNHFNFHGINLDDLFHDIDDDELSSFGKWFDSSTHNHFHHPMEGQFGDGQSWFGSHFPSQIQDSLHNYQHVHQNSHSYSCQTITRQVNGVMMTQTSCS